MASLFAAILTVLIALAMIVLAFAAAEKMRKSTSRVVARLGFGVWLGGMSMVCELVRFVLS
jgi:putative copper export protein